MSNVNKCFFVSGNEYLRLVILSRFAIWVIDGERATAIIDAVWPMISEITDPDKTPKRIWIINVNPVFSMRTIRQKTRRCLHAKMMHNGLVRGD